MKLPDCYDMGLVLMWTGVLGCYSLLSHSDLMDICKFTAGAFCIFFVLALVEKNSE